MDISGHAHPIAAFCADIGGIEHTTDARKVRVKSRDRFELSPMLAEALAGRLADVVVSPADEAELSLVLSAAARHRIPVTVRAGGSANYGQSVPLRGGIILDVLKLSGIIETGPGHVRLRAGSVFAKVDRELRAQGRELRFLPSTYRVATIGGNFSGGIGGPGSFAYGSWADAGNVISLKVMTLEEEPQIIELSGEDATRPFHTYGATGVITEMTLPLAPAWDWQEAIFAFDDFPAAIGAACELAESYTLTKKLLSVHEWPSPSYVLPLKELVPEGKTMLMTMVAGHSWTVTAQMMARHGGTLVSRAAEGEAAYRIPMYELVFGHMLQHVQKTHKDVTLTEGFVSGAEMRDIICRAHAACRGYGPMGAEFMRQEGRMTAMVSPYFRYGDAGRMADVIRALQSAGVVVRNPHTTTVRAVGKKRILPEDIAFKRRVDPHGLMNPGRFEPDERDDATATHQLPTDRWDRELT